MTPSLPPNDNDRTACRTVMLPGENALPVGTKVKEFEIKDVIGWGGFGIVYLASDNLGREVALKEYMPSAFAMRDSSATVTVKSEQYKDTFLAGLRSFINEGQLLASFDHPSLVKVYQFWEENGTAYMVMPFLQGLTLKETLLTMDKPPGETWLMRLLAQLLDALSVLHKDQCFHRDIAPDNILIRSDGRPLLLDFGAARRMISDMTQTLNVILKPGYAPVEQYYSDNAANEQGPWTDIYALAAVVYFSITGQAPTESIRRMKSDTLIPLSEAAAGRYSAHFLKCIDWALAIRPEERPQSVDEFRALLFKPKETNPPIPFYKKIINALIDRKLPTLFYVASIVTIFVVVYKFIIVSYPESLPEQIPKVVEPRLFNPIKALDDIYDNRDLDHAVAVSVDKAQVRIEKEELRFKISSAKSGYIYILMVDKNNSEFFLLFPNTLDKNNYIEAGSQLNLPRSQWKLTAKGPAGTSHFIAIVSENKRDFNHTGLIPFKAIAKFPFEQATELYQSYTGSLPLFAGKALCPPSSTVNCKQSYGAAMFSIEEIEE